MFEFMDFDYLTDGEIDLVIDRKTPANEEKGYVPAYIFNVCIHNSDAKIGSIDIRIGHNENTHYGGNIGYEIDEDYRGKNYASKACKLIKQVAVAHGMKSVIITCNPTNVPSRRTCEKAGARLVEIVDLPTHNEMYQSGDRQKCRYELTL